ncbi:hypothetical protein BBJ28_00005950 [Nothophytophthora sp. Chile5]|nr:hypothetical protein BBJ28_00005950 [Nothophytophthora sp. Chile5]
MALPFPTKQPPFPRVELDEAERRHYHTLATELLAQALNDYDEHAIVRHRQVDKKRWKPVRSHESLAVYRESRSYAARRMTHDSLSSEDDESFAMAAASTPVNSSGRRLAHSNSQSSNGSGSAPREPPIHHVSEMELLAGWGPTATEVRQQKKRAKSRSSSASNGQADQLPVLLGVGSIVGSLDDVMYGIAAPDCASMALKAAYSHDDVLDGDVLCAIEGPSQRSPFRFLGLKWLVKATTGTVKHRMVWPRDLVYLEATGVITRGDGVRVGYQLMQSVTLPGCPEIKESHGVVRARCESVHLFVALNNNTVDVYLKSRVTPNGKIPESAALQSCANTLLYCGKTVLCAQSKKLAWRLDRDTHGGTQIMRMNEAKAKPTRCSICSKSFGRFHRQVVECKLCFTAMCAKCCVERPLRHVETAGKRRKTCKFVTTRVVELCKSCITSSTQASALTIAREEVLSGRFGRVAKASSQPSQRQYSDDRSDYAASVATIGIDDLPGNHEHAAHPPKASEARSGRGYQPQYAYPDAPVAEDAGRGYRDQGAYRDAPLGDDNYGKGYRPQYAHPDAPVSEANSRRGRGYREAETTSRRGHHEPVYHETPVGEAASRAIGLEPPYHEALVVHEKPGGGQHRPVYQEGRGVEDNYGGNQHHPMHHEARGEKGSNRAGQILSGYQDMPVELDNSGRGGRSYRDTPVVLFEAQDLSPCTPRAESVGKATSSSSSSLEAIHTAGVSPSPAQHLATSEQPEAEKEGDDEARDTLDDMDDLVAVCDDLDDVDEMLDTKDMQAVRRRSQYNRQLWNQIAELRDAAENVYQYTKTSTAVHLTAASGSARAMRRSKRNI